MLLFLLDYQCYAHKGQADGPSQIYECYCCHYCCGYSDKLILNSKSRLCSIPRGCIAVDRPPARVQDAWWLPSYYY